MINENNLQNNLDQYMKARFMAEEAEKELRNLTIENFADEIVSEQYEDHFSDFEILEFIDNKDLINNSLIKKGISKIDSEASNSVIVNLVSSWIDDYENETIHDSEILGFIDSALHNFKKEEKLNKSERSLNKSRIHKTIFYTALSAAASVLLIITVYLFSGKQPSSQEIFSEYYDTYEYIGTEIRSSENNQSSLLREASGLYSNKKYDEAVIKYKDFIANDETYVQAYLYLGISQTEIKQYKEAVKTFEQIISGFDEFEIESKWYAALCYLMLDENEPAINYLKEISETNCIWQKDAVQILKNFQ